MCLGFIPYFDNKCYDNRNPLVFLQLDRNKKFDRNRKNLIYFSIINNKL